MSLDFRLALNLLYSNIFHGSSLKNHWWEAQSLWVFIIRYYTILKSDFSLLSGHTVLTLWIVFLESERFICWRLLYFYFWQRKEQLQAALGEPTFALLICQANDFTISDNMTHQLMAGQSIAPCKWNKYTSSSKPVSFTEANTFWNGQTGVWSKPLGLGKEMRDRIGSSKREEAEESQFFSFL